MFTYRMVRALAVAAVGVVMGAGTSAARAQPCLSWSPEFAGQDLDERSRCSAYYDDGTGTQLYVGGSFLNAGGQSAKHIARWNGSTWSAVGSGVNPVGGSTGVNTMLVWNDGSGDALYCGGNFDQIGGVTANGLARYKNGTWQALAGGLIGNLNALAVYDDGGGPALYAGGSFTLDPGQTVIRYVAKWTGTSWIDTGLQWDTARIESLAVFNGELWAGTSQLVTANGVAKCLAKYDGSQWYPVSAITDSGVQYVYAMMTCDLGSGPRLIIGGNFQKILGQTFNGIAAWDGSSWSAFGDGVPARALLAYDDGLGMALYAGWDFTLPGGSKGVAKWDGFSWSGLGSGVNSTVYGFNTRSTDAGTNLLVLGEMTSAGGQSCSRFAEWNSASWISHGNGLSEPGSPSVWTLAEYDDGSGAAMFAGGPFNKAGPVTSQAIARWGYGAWSAMPSMGGSVINAMLGYDDGTGTQLYVTGDSGIRRWNGSSWNTPGFVDGRIEDLAEFNDGTGNALYAVGSFVGINGVPATGCGAFDGSAWQGFSGLNSNEVAAVVLYDAGAGPEPYVGGTFTSASGNACSRIARWNGSSWQPVGTGLNNTVSAMAVHNDGSGNALYVCGQFSQAGGVPAMKVAKWNGSAWSAVGAGLNGFSANVLASLDVGGGARLYAGGNFSVSGEGRMLLVWDGATWSPVGDGGTSGTCSALAVYDDGAGSKLFAGGSIGFAGGQSVQSIVRLDGNSWTKPGGGFNGPVASLCVFDDGTGSKLYAGGGFYHAFGVGTVEHVARWNGTAWSAVGQGLAPEGGSTFNGEVNSLNVCDFGAGSILVAGGYFDRSGAKPLASMAQWDGSGWAGVSSAGVLKGNRVKSMVVNNSGTNSVLYFAGLFGRCGVEVCRGVARWNGSEWEAVGSPGDGFDNTATAAAVYDGGSGPALYVGGDFQNVHGVPASRMARWDGAAWSAVGSGVNLGVGCLLVHDDGAGSALFVAGGFTTAGGTSAPAIARWNGAAWSGVGGGMTSGTSVRAMAVYDEGAGPALYAGGTFTEMGGTLATNIARWDGSAWTAVESGLTGGTVRALAVGGPFGARRLFAGGAFTIAGGLQSLRIASWGPCPPRASDIYCPSDFNQDHFVSGDDFDAFVDAFFLGDPSADVNHDTFVSGDDFDYFVEHFEAGC